MGIDQQVVLREVEEGYAEPHQDKSEMIAYVKQIMTPDPQRYRGLRRCAGMGA